MGNQLKPFSSERLHAELTAITDQRYFCVAYSGGLDSHVLLQAMAALRDAYPDYHLRAVHIHHGLSPRADEWVSHCSKTAKALSIPLLVEYVTLDMTSGESVEALARTARYDAFSTILRPEECLLTAHTQDDQVETLFLQLFRGAGVNGLASMPLKKTLGKGCLLRPLLGTTREALEEYASTHALTWVEDDSNQSDRFDRNYLRHHVLPLIKKRWPSVLDTVSRSARHCGQDASALKELASSDLQAIQVNPFVLSIDALQALSSERRAHVLRYWITLSGHRAPSSAQLDRIEQDLVFSEGDASPAFRREGLVLRRYRNRLHRVVPDEIDFDTSVCLAWDMKKPLALPHGELVVKSVLGQGLRESVQQLTLRFRQGGERCQPSGRVGHHPLKKLFQEWGVPPWQRDRVPVLYEGDRMVAVVGYCVCEGYLAEPHRPGKVVEFLENNYEEGMI